ncbi:hypothetical protein C0J52_26837 [Blattella germanica]|nr:hypothetical protein C0J52_26837 [Blattella germanica]
MTAGNAEPLDLGDESVNEPTESEKNNNEKMNGSECNGTNSSTVVQEDSNEKIKPLILVRDKLQYDPTWLEPSPEDFVLVADSVEGIRELLDSFCDDNVELIHRLDRSKKDVRSRPNCEVRLTGRLRMLLSDVEPLEHVFLNNVKTYRRKLHEEWSNFVNRPPDFVDPDEAFWLNEKDSTTEVIENEVPDTPDQTKVNNDELPPAVPVPTDVSEDVPGLFVRVYFNQGVGCDYASSSIPCVGDFAPFFIKPTCNIHILEICTCLPLHFFNFLGFL